MYTPTVIQFSKQQVRRRRPGEDHVRRCCLPPMRALTPWWPVLLGLYFWSDMPAAHAAALEGPQAGDLALAKVIPMAGLKARRVL